MLMVADIKAGTTLLGCERGLRHPRPHRPKRSNASGESI